MTIFKLDDHEHLFKDFESYMQFARALKHQSKQNFVPLVSDGRVIGCLMNAAYTKKILTERLVDRALSDPDLLTKVLG